MTCQRCQAHLINGRRTLAPLVRRQRQLSTSTCVQSGVGTAPDIKAARPVDFTNLSQAMPARILPSSPSYFTASPTVSDDYLLLCSLVRRHQYLPTIPSDKVPRMLFMKYQQYVNTHGEATPASMFSKMIHMLRRLNRIHPRLRLPIVRATIQKFKRPGDDFLEPPKLQSLDEHGRARGVGRRKESTARVYLVEGNGEVLVNGKSVVQVFPRIHDRESALWALKVTQRLDKYNVWALVQGGGVTGQAESITLALAKALLVHEPALKPALRRGKPFIRVVNLPSGPCFKCAGCWTGVWLTFCS